MKNRLANFTFGRFYSCLWTSLCVVILFKVIGILFHMNLPGIVALAAFLILFFTRLWKVCEEPPARQDYPFSHM